MAALINAAYAVSDTGITLSTTRILVEEVTSMIRHGEIWAPPRQYSAIAPIGVELALVLRLFGAAFQVKLFTYGCFTLIRFFALFYSTWVEGSPFATRHSHSLIITSTVE